MTRGISLNRNQLKYLAIAAMLIDHIAWGFVPTFSPAGEIMHFIGRLTGPTMAYFIYEGYLHTRDVRKYALRLGLFALLSWVPFSLFEMLRWPTAYFGVIYTLFLGLLAVWLWDKAPIAVFWKVLLVALLCFFSLFGDWMGFDVLWPLFLFIYRNDEKKQWRSFWLICAAAVALCWYAIYTPYAPWGGAYNLGVFAVPPLLRYGYNGEPGSRNPFHRWVFYFFYPAHLLILALLRLRGF